MAKKKEVKNIGASVREKLLNIAKRNNLNYDSVLLQYFIVTLEYTDGIVFFPETITVETIKQDQVYKGINVRVKAELAGARKIIIVDIGFGDKVVPNPVKINFPILLDFPAPQINVYSRESVIAEKFEAIVILQILNSRMKDFYDIWYLASTQNFNIESLRKSIYTTFNQRGTSIDNRKFIFREEFKNNPDKQKQWKAFLLKNNLFSLEQFAEVMDKMELFLAPVCIDMIHNESHLIWNNQLWKWVDKNSKT